MDKFFNNILSFPNTVTGPPPARLTSPPGGPARPATSAMAVSPSSSTPCKYYQTGFCKYGSSCHYLHILGPQLSEAEKVTMDIPYVSKTLFPIHAQNYKAAGVLPYRVKEGRVEVLLGYEKRHSKTKAFLGKFLNILGGMRDHSDKDFITTAVREFWEESARVLPKESVDTMQQILNTSAADVFWWPKGKYALVMYHMTHDEQLAEIFASTDRSKLRHAEMEELHWVPLEVLLLSTDSQQVVWNVPQSGRQLQVYDMVLLMVREHELRNFLYGLMNQLSQLGGSQSSVGVGDIEFELMRSLSAASVFASNNSMVCTKCATRIANSIIYKCADCPNHVLCYGCFVKRKVEHPPSHLFVIVEELDLHRGHTLLEDTSILIHENATCHYCKMKPIVGIRWECNELLCKEIQMCNACESTGKHPRDHTLLKIRNPIPNVPLSPKPTRVQTAPSTPLVNANQ